MAMYNIIFFTRVQKTLKLILQIKGADKERKIFYFQEPFIDIGISQMSIFRGITMLGIICIPPKYINIYFWPNEFQPLNIIKNKHVGCRVDYKQQSHLLINF